MGLAQFITDNIEPILVEWEAFARSLPPGRNMSSVGLRNDAERMLRFVAADMGSVQTDAQRDTKGKGLQPEGGDDSAAHTHGRLRLLQAFDLAQMVGEFRALRASVLRLWSTQAGYNAALASEELIRFNEAIDQVLAESVQRFAEEMERSRELLLGVLGHDLRTPLSSIRMAAEVLARTPSSPRHAELATGIIRSSERMKRMVYDLLDFTRTRLGAKLVLAKERCDLAEVCREIAGEVQAANPDREIKVQFSGVCAGEWDCQRMAQLVSNLVSNALQHGAAGTPIMITTAGDDLETVILNVENQGRPIRAEEQSSIFEPLTRGAGNAADGKTGSIGLGLYIAKEIAIAHSGKIELVRSEPSGTCFQVTLPRGRSKT
jgi:signal transduction histidine kinase